MYKYSKSQPSQKDVIIKIPVEINSIKELKRDEKIILSQILFFEGLKNKDHRAKNKYFAKLIDKSERTVQRCIKKLEELGFLMIEIFDNFDRVIRISTEKIFKIMSKGYDKVSQVIDNTTTSIKSNFQSITGKTRTFFKRKDIKENYKKPNENYIKNKIQMYQFDDETNEQFDNRCGIRELLGDVEVDRRYSIAKNNLKINVVELLKQGYSKARNQINV
jgi:Helix-turn-helix domain